MNVSVLKFTIKKGAFSERSAFYVLLLLLQHKDYFPRYLLIPMVVMVVVIMVFAVIFVIGSKVKSLFLICQAKS